MNENTVEAIKTCLSRGQSQRKIARKLGVEEHYVNDIARGLSHTASRRAPKLSARTVKAIAEQIEAGFQIVDIAKYFSVHPSVVGGIAAGDRYTKISGFTPSCMNMGAVWKASVPDDAEMMELIDTAVGVI